MPTAFAFLVTKIKIDPAETNPTRWVVSQDHLLSFGLALLRAIEMSHVSIHWRKYLASDRLERTQVGATSPSMGGKEAPVSSLELPGKQNYDVDERGRGGEETELSLTQRLARAA